MGCGRPQSSCTMKSHFSMNDDFHDSKPYRQSAPFQLTSSPLYSLVSLDHGVMCNLDWAEFSTACKDLLPGKGLLS